MTAAKAQLQQMIAESNLSSVTDVYAFMKDSFKDALSITVGANESSKFWLGMLNDLKNRGVPDVLFFCVDGLSSFREAIHTAFPKSAIQWCIIHMLRNSFQYTSYQAHKKFATDFKFVYNAPTEDIALSELANVKEKWGKKYPYAISSWEKNWQDICSFYQFREEIRKVMYTTYTDIGIIRQMSWKH